MRPTQWVAVEFAGGAAQMSPMPGAAMAEFNHMVRGQETAPISGRIHL